MINSMDDSRMERLLEFVLVEPPDSQDLKRSLQ